MKRLARVSGALLLVASATSLAASKKFVPPPMPPGFDDPGVTPADPVGQIAAGLRGTLKDAYTAREFALCSSRVLGPQRAFSPTDPWVRAERLVYFLVNAKNAYGAYTGLQEGVASFRDGRLIELSLTVIGDEYPDAQEKMAMARGDCHSMPDADFQRLVGAR